MIPLRYVFSPDSIVSNLLPSAASARALHYLDESTHDSVQRLQPLRHVGREEHENASALLHQLLELVCEVCFVNRCIVTHQQHTLRRIGGRKDGKTKDFIKTKSLKGGV
jgi:hypothetical protein